MPTHFDVLIKLRSDIKISFNNIFLAGISNFSNRATCEK